MCFFFVLSFAFDDEPLFHNSISSFDNRKNSEEYKTEEEETVVFRYFSFYWITTGSGRK